MLKAMEWSNALLLAVLMGCCQASQHYGKGHLTKRQGGNSGATLHVENMCTDELYPGVLTQSGDGPGTTGFRLSAGESRTLNVSSDWIGRIWGRTNCTFDSDGEGNRGGRSCSTGDCGPSIECNNAAGLAPATLAEFTLSGSSQQTFYDISLVDGYNLDMAILLNARSDNPNGHETNPSCVASVSNFSTQTPYDPYSDGGQTLGTTQQNPMTFENRVTEQDVRNWCPWDLQQDPPQKPGDGVYPYPDTGLSRPLFNPCFSACAKYNKDSDCCVGTYDDPNKCKGGDYSKAAKKVCPDAYSFAYDDQDSTFVVPQGGDYDIIFCPGGRSTNILASGSGQSSGSVSNGKEIILIKMGRLVIDGRAAKAGLASLMAVMLASFLLA